MPGKNTTAYAKWQVKDESTALPLVNFKDNDGVYVISESAEGTTYTVTDKTDTYSFIYDFINLNAKEFRVVEATFVGTKGCHILFKLEGGNAAAVEKSVLMTGEEQTFTWVVKAANMTDEGGQRLLIFLNPGNKGSNYKDEAGNDKVFEEAPYVTIKSCALYKPIDANETNPNSAIYFEANGGSKVAPLSAAKGAEITAPKAPTKQGHVFLGWYDNAECVGAEYEFTTMPEKAVLLYAKWEKVVSVLEDTYAPLDADTYTFKYNNGVLKIKKTGTGEWQFAKGTLTGADIVGNNVLGVTLKGVAGQVITFKINDQYEKAVVCDGTVQHVEIDFSHIKIDGAKPALVMFINGGVAAQSEEFEVYDLYFTNHKNLLNDGYAGNDADTYTFEVVDGVLKAQKTGTGAWQFAKGELTGADILGYGKMVVTLKGAAGQKVMFKINDQYEYWITCDGTTRTHTIDFSHLTINEDKPAMIMFLNAGVDAASEVIEIYSMELTDYVAPVTEPKSVDMLDDTFVANDFCTVTQENGVLTVKKNSGSPYESASSTLKADILSDLNVLKVEFQGAAGQEVIFKIGNENGALECKVVCNGAVQYVEYPFSLPVPNANNAALVIMPGVDKEGASETLTITHLEFANYRSRENMLADTFVANDFCTVTQENGVLTVKKNSGSPYESASSTLKADILVNFSVLKVEFQGAAGQEVIFKIGNENGALECKVVCDGNVQYVEHPFSLPVPNANNAALVIMPGVDKEGASETLTVTRLEFATEFDHVSVLTGWTENDEDSYVITEAEGSTTFKKNDTRTTADGEVDTAWCFVKKSLSEVTNEKYTTLVITFTGSIADQEVIFALGAVEAKPRTTGAEQTIEINFGAVIPNTTELKIFLNAGISGSCDLVITEMYLK